MTNNKKEEQEEERIFFLLTFFSGMTALFLSFLSNPNLALNDLQLSGNALDDKVDVFCRCLSHSLSYLTKLDIGNIQLGRKGLAEILVEMNKCEKLKECLIEFDISQNKFSDVSSKELGSFIENSKSLVFLSIGSDSLNFSILNDG